MIKKLKHIHTNAGIQIAKHRSLPLDTGFVCREGSAGRLKLRYVGFSRAEPHVCKVRKNFYKHALDVDAVNDDFGCEELGNAARLADWVTPGESLL